MKESNQAKIEASKNSQHLHNSSRKIKKKIDFNPLNKISIAVNFTNYLSTTVTIKKLYDILNKYKY